MFSKKSILTALSAIMIATASHAQLSYYETTEMGYLNHPMQTKSGVVVTTNRANELYLMKDNQLKPLVVSLGAGMYTQLSADKSTIGFKSITSDYKQAPALLDVATGKVTLLEDYIDQCGQVSFANDGTMAYTMGNKLVIRKGDSRKYIDLGTYVNIVNISPDATRAAYSTIEGQMYIVDLNSGYKQYVSNVVDGYNPIWSPDGSKIAMQIVNGDLKVLDTVTKASFDLGKATSVAWDSKSEDLVLTRTELENDFKALGASVLQMRFDGTNMRTIVPLTEDCPISVSLSADNNAIVSYAAGDKRGLSRVTFSGEKFTLARPNEVSMVTFNKNEALKINLGVDMAKKTAGAKLLKERMEAEKVEFDKGLKQKSNEPKLIGALDIPYINQVWDTPTCYNGHVEWGYVCCAPSSCCMNLGYFKLLNPHGVTSRYSGVGTVYYSWYVGRDYTSPKTGYTFNYHAYFTPTWGSYATNNIGGAYGHMWGYGSPASMMAAFYTRSGMTSSSFTSSWGTLVSECNNSRPYTICLNNGTSGHVVLVFRGATAADPYTGAMSGCNGSFVCHDPFGDYNGASYPNWDGRYATYDWPGYSNGHANIGTFYWGCVATPPSGSVTPPAEPKLEVSPSSLNFECYPGEHPTKTFTVKGENLSSDITIASMTPGRFTPDGHNTGSYTISKSGGTVTVGFNITDKIGTYGPGGSAVDYDFKIKVKSGSLSKEVKLTATVKAPPLDNINEKWNLSDKRGSLASKGYDANKIRNFAYNDGKLYCVYNHSDILVLNAQTGESLGTLNLGNVVSGGTLKLCDVKVLDGHVVACNLAASGQELRLYAWDNDQSEPYLLYNTTEMNGAARIGDCMELAGKYDSDLYITFGNDNGGVTRIIQYRRNSGNWSTQVYEVQKDGKQYATGSTTRVYCQPGNGYWVDGKSAFPAWTTLSGNVANVGCTNDTGKKFGSSHHEFRWKTQKYAANLVFSGDTNYTKPQMRIIMDIAGNFSNISEVGYYPSDGLSDQVCGNTGACGDCIINTDGDNYLEAWVLAFGQGLAYYTKGNVPAKNPSPIEPLKPTIKSASNSVSLETFKDGFAEQKLKISGVCLTENINFAVSGTNAEYFSVSTNHVSKDGGEISIYYAPKAVGNHTARLTASSEGADDVVIELKGTAKTPTQFVDNIDALTEMWNKSGSNVEASWVTATENYIRNIAYQDGKIYMVLCKPWGSPEIKILDAYTGDVKGSLNMEGVSGGTAAVSGIVAVGGKIFASNIATAAQVFRIYRWDSDGAAPAVALEIAANGHATSAIGGQLSFSGDLNNGRFWSSDNGTNNLIYFNVSGGNINATVNKLALKNGDKDFTVGDGRGTASVQVASDGTLYVASKDAYPAHFNADGTMIEQLQANTCNNTPYGAALNVFTFGSKRYAVAGTYTDANKITKGAFTLINITDGFAAAESPIGMYPAAGFDSANGNPQRLQSLAVSTRDNGHVLDVWFATCMQGLCYYSYNGIKPADAIEDVISETPEVALLYTGTEIQVEGVQAANIAVYSISGALVRNESNSNIVNVEGLHGVYIAVVVDTEGNTFTKKFMLK